MNNSPSIPLDKSPVLLSCQWMSHAASVVQGLDKGFQSMAPDIWLSAGNPWEVYRPELAYKIGFYGTVENGTWIPAESVRNLHSPTRKHLIRCLHNDLYPQKGIALACKV